MHCLCNLFALCCWRRPLGDHPTLRLLRIDTDSPASTTAPARWQPFLVPCCDGFPPGRPNRYRCHLLDLRLPASLEGMWLRGVHSVENLSAALLGCPRLKNLVLNDFGNPGLKLDIAPLTALTSLKLHETPVAVAPLASTSVRKLLHVGDYLSPDHFVLGVLGPASMSMRRLPRLEELSVACDLYFQDASEVMAAARQLRGLTMLQCSNEGGWIENLHQLTNLRSLKLLDWKDHNDEEPSDPIAPPASLETFEMSSDTDAKVMAQVLLDLAGCTRLESLDVHDNTELMPGSLDGLTTSLRRLELYDCVLREGELLDLPASLSVVSLKGCMIDAPAKQMRPVCQSDLPDLPSAQVEIIELDMGHNGH